MAGAIVGTLQCVCGAKVPVRLSAKGRGWYHCKGELDRLACDARLTMGERMSRELRERTDRGPPEQEPAPDGQRRLPADRPRDPWGDLGIRIPDRSP